MHKTVTNVSATAQLVADTHPVVRSICQKAVDRRISPRQSAALELRERRILSSSFDQVRQIPTRQRTI